LDYADTFYDYELYDDAAAQFRLVVAIRPRFVFARHQLIRSLLRSGDHAEAAEAVREAVKLAPLSPSLENELKSHGIVW
jgi:tetratricopeptide (TPR) repeat protein